MLTRRGEQSGRCLHVSGLQAGLAAILGVAFAVLAVLLPLHYYQALISRAEVVSLKSEVDDLRRDNKGFRVAARQLESHLSSLEIAARKLKLGAGLDTESMGGVGGPSRRPDPATSLSQKDLLGHFQHLDQRRITLAGEFRRLQDYYTTREILLAATPSIMPTTGYPSGRFGRRTDPFNGSTDFHPGIDISAPRGAKVLATADGLVVAAGRRSEYGKLVTIGHKLGVSTRYGHLDRFAVRVGDRVRRGDVIGYVGSTGRSTGPHLHYEVRLNGQAFNPLRFVSESFQE